MPFFDNQTKIIIIIVGILAIIYFLYKINNEKSKNKSELFNSNVQNLSESDSESINYNDNASESSQETDTHTYGDYKTQNNRHYKTTNVPKDVLTDVNEQTDYAPPETTDWLRQKFKSRNKAKNGYKRSSYSGSVRGNLGSDDWKSYFDHNNNMVSDSQSGDNNNFLPVDESGAGFAAFKSSGKATCGSNQNCEPEDLFDADKYLPQETNDNWFDVQKEPISVKNRHLINMTHHIGVNTVGSSLKNASLDLRGSPANPKFVVSPWNQSSIEPDTNQKPLY